MHMAALRVAEEAGYTLVADSDGRATSFRAVGQWGCRARVSAETRGAYNSIDNTTPSMMVFTKEERNNGSNQGL
ncbi:hypothetical protein V6N13_049532 [Hibiscus sabdariffa]|uniref:Uncharacterized protein n=1 Tax=Hibiscus sabdariffa TaxID=183260 RepID=A0ABR2QXJ2_9ROSI